MGRTESSALARNGKRANNTMIILQCGHRMEYPKPLPTANDIVNCILCARPQPVVYDSNFPVTVECSENVDVSAEYHPCVTIQQFKSLRSAKKCYADHFWQTSSKDMPGHRSTIKYRGKVIQ